MDSCSRPPLRLLQASTRALETCAYCPRLCRAACPVAEAESSETLTPWGKMLLAWHETRGEVPLDAEHTRSAWACTSCAACRERCDHQNPVAGTLLDARADYFEAGLAPEAARRVAETHDERMQAVAARIAELRREPGVAADSPTGLLLGCGYALELPEEARAAIRVAVALVGPVRLIEGCCGQALDAAGARAAGDRSRAALARETAGCGVKTLLVVDPGCAVTLSFLPLAPPAALTMQPLVALAASRLARFRAVPELAGAALRWHDPCQLGRGLGLYDEPRALLARVAGRAPDEFGTRREFARCSGAGGLLPVTEPEVAARIAATRLAEHEAEGGGTVVTACASSVRHLRRSGATVVDLVSLLAQGLA